jgi:zinc transport system substrate-binding protein
VAFLINKVKKEQVPVIFHIELSNKRMADTISEATGAKKLLLHSCHNVTKNDFEKGITYLELQKTNVINLKEALW